MNLNDYVKKVSQEDFQKNFKHTATWNKRLRTTGGRFHPNSGNLDFNPKVYEALGLEVFRKIVRHELCHYHLYFEKKGYRHQDRDFKQLLKAVNGLRFVPKINDEVYPYHYQCQACGQDYFRKRKMNLKRYVCGRCHSQLYLMESF